ncbi:MAG: hypothetical protein Q8N68_03100 [bacterium]|nr:hypothetical protein [bacterium]
MKTAVKSFLVLFILFFLSGKTTNIRYLFVGMAVVIACGLTLFILIAIDCHRRSNPHYTDMAWKRRQKLIHSIN